MPYPEKDGERAGTGSGIGSGAENEVPESRTSRSGVSRPDRAEDMGAEDMAAEPLDSGEDRRTAMALEHSETDDAKKTYP